MMRGQLVVALAAVFGAGCACVPPKVVELDGGEPAVPQCVTEAECPLGDTCVDGRCVTPQSQDAATGCTTDQDCPVGQRCLKSAGLCIDVASDAGQGPGDDAGVTGECFEGQTQTCGSSKLGECRLGTQACALGGGVFAFGPCVGAIDPTAELCNGLDDDCDGLADDGFAPATCGVGECARTVETCAGGVAITCAPGPSSAEVCDGRDNDCNGTVDDGLAALTCGLGACARTVPACVAGAAQTCTPGTGGLESCNGVDDDCDGATDENLGQRTCGLGQCTRTVEACTNGSATPCTPGTPGTEACNTLDDDCDGLIDETCACTDGATQPCYTGTPGTAGVGVCRSGTQTCAGGQWGACTGQNTGGAETCNGLDDDCDASADEGLGQSTCGVGACVRTVQNCVSGAPQACTAGPPGAESCNGVDDDCNGTADDGLGTTSCGVGVCARTVAACAGGAPQSCTAGTPGLETCNGLDDDCDGATDEAFPQQGQACATGVPGLCATGQASCAGGALGCTQTVTPIAELCGNGLDENCNGTADDPMACGCSTAIDRDFDGANECVDCNDLDGTIRPGAAEVCNGKDDDCDALRDEGFDVDADGFTTCGTVATGGVDPLRRDCNDGNAFVFPLKVTDCGAAATPASPNGIDDNCNGYVDETCACDTRDRDADGVTECAGDCNDNDATIAPNRAEVCDGKDNDCTTATVDNCGVSQPCGRRQGASYVPYPAGTDRCRADLICVTVVSTGELVCGSFCNQTTGQGLNDSCQPTEGCFSNLLDSANQHLCSVRAAGTRTTGQTCAADSECRSTDCSDETTRYCTDKCTHEAGCSANTTCFVERQRLSTMPTNPAAYLYSFCRLDSLLTGTKTLGQTCTGSECRTGAEGCFNGRCVEPCCAHADCPSGYACSINGPTANTGYVSGSTPIVSIVPSCLASTATRVSGAACTANADCRSGLCERTLNVCVDLCCNDSSCPNGTTCEPVDYRQSNGNQSFVRACLFSPVPTLIQQK